MCVTIFENHQNLRIVFLDPEQSFGTKLYPPENNVHYHIAHHAERIG